MCRRRRVATWGRRGRGCRTLASPRNHPGEAGLLYEVLPALHPIQIGEGKRLADELHNARAILRDHRAMGEAIWERFNSTEPAEVVGEIRVGHERGTQAGPA